MKKRFERALIAAAAAVLSAIPCPAQTPEVSGAVSTWASVHVLGPVVPLLGLRYLPVVAFEKALSGGAALRFEASLNVFGTVSFPSENDVGTDGRARLYRGWARYATPRFEARLGLQRLDFGSATIIRPLMWFDRIDPRDPLQIADGVMGLLFKYTFQSNANIWVWGLYGNDDPKGWEIYPTARRRPEFGCRLQLQIPKGEIALTYHHRQVNVSPGVPNVFGAFPEDRIGVDGKWDVGVGLWFEGTLVRTVRSGLPLPFRRALTVGADYTFAVGKGLHVLGEHFLLQDSTTTFGAGLGRKISVLTVSYPISILDSLSGIFYYDWENRCFFRFLNWRKTFDRWSFHLIGFWNPEMLDIYRPGTAGASFGGKGIQVMAIFNH